MKSNKKISVIMSAYNSEDSVENSITSILNQTYEDLELLIMDDASTDNTFKICESLKNKDQRIKLYKNKSNLGLTKSLNKLISLSSGEIIARQDSDDLSKKERIEKQLKFLEENNLDACTSRAKIMYSQKITPRFSLLLPKKLVIKYKNPFIHGTLMIKKRVIVNLGMYDENFYYAQDYKLMTDLLNINSKYKILRTPYYKLNFENNISTKFKEEQKYYAFCVKKKLTPYS